MAKKASQPRPQAANPFEGEDESRERRISILLKSTMTLAGWSKVLDKNAAGETYDLMDEWTRLSRNLSEIANPWSDEPLPGDSDAERYSLIADLLACWMDEKTSIDPSPLLAASRYRVAFGEWREPTPLFSYIPKDRWERWVAAARDAEIVLDRASLWLRRKSGQKVTRENPRDRRIKKDQRIRTAIESIIQDGKDRDLSRDEIDKSLTVRLVSKIAGVGISDVSENPMWRLIMGERRQKKRELGDKTSGRTSSIQEDFGDDDQ